MSSPVRLREFNNSWYSPGRSVVWRTLWMFLGLPLFRCSLLPFSSVKVALLRLFGAQVGQRVVIRSEVSVKYPWHLVIGNDCWIGEKSWFDNLTTISLGNDVCVSQGVYFCTGNHDWNDPHFGLRIEPIYLFDGSWAGAMSRLLPGTILSEGAVAAAGSVITGTVPPYEIFSGNPAKLIRKRKLDPSVSNQVLAEVHAQ